jgi:aspartate aminotransferase-like enzyme
MTSIRLAGEAITSLSRKAWEQFKKQNRVTYYFEKKDGHNQKNRRTEGSN